MIRVVLGSLQLGMRGVGVLVTAGWFTRETRRGLLSQEGGTNKKPPECLAPGVCTATNCDYLAGRLAIPDVRASASCRMVFGIIDHMSHSADTVPGTVPSIRSGEGLFIRIPPAWVRAGVFVMVATLLRLAGRPQEHIRRA